MDAGGILVHGGVVLLDEAGGDHVARQLLRRSAHRASCAREGQEGCSRGMRERIMFMPKSQGVEKRR